MRPLHVLLPAARSLRPLMQGDSSSLCGLYSILNGIQLALWPLHKLTRAQRTKLVRIAVTSLEKDNALAEVIGAGMAEETWVQLSAHLVSHVPDITGSRLRQRFILRHEPALTSRRATTVIKSQIRAGAPVMLLIWGAYNHCTVAVGYTSSRLLLFDSSGFKWIHFRNLGLHYMRSAKLHQIARWSAMTLIRTP